MDKPLEELANILDYTAKQLKAKDSALRKTYGINIQDFYKILAAQGMKCPVCEKAYNRKSRFCVDHEHGKGGNGPVRGIICMYCNTRIIGSLKVEKAKRAYMYLLAPPAINAIGSRITLKTAKSKRIRSAVGRSRKRGQANAQHR